MAYTIVQSTRVHEAANVTAWSTTFPSATQTGNLLVAVAWATDANFDVMANLPCTDDGTNTWASARQMNHTTGGFVYSRIGILYVENATGKSGHLVTVTPAVSSGAFSGIGDLEIFEISGMKSSGALDAVTTYTGSTITASSYSLTSSADGVRIAAIGYGHFANLTTTPNAAFTTAFNPGASYGAHASYTSAPSGAATTATWTFSPDAPTDYWAAIHAIFLEGTAAGSSSRVFMMGSQDGLGSSGRFFKDRVD